MYAKGRREEEGRGEEKKEAKVRTQGIVSGAVPAILGHSRIIIPQACHSRGGGPA